MTKKHVYDYSTEKSRKICDHILAYLLGRPLHGATQKEVAGMLDASLSTTSRFLNWLVAQGKIHVSRPVRPSQQGSLPAIYKHGPPIVPRIKPGLVYDELPLAFFKGSRHASD